MQKMRHWSNRLPLVLVVALGTGQACSYGVGDISSVPAAPTYNHDIRPFLAEHCLLCHSSPPNRGAPSYFRLDVYDNVGTVSGAKSEADRILIRVGQNTMPPGASSGDGVGPNGLQMIESWVNNGLPE
jgi:hypothetical protein